MNLMIILLLFPLETPLFCSKGTVDHQLIFLSLKDSFTWSKIQIAFWGWRRTRRSNILQLIYWSLAVSS